MSHLEGKRIAILAEEDFEDVELVEPIKAMKEAGAKVVDYRQWLEDQIQGKKRYCNNKE